MGSSGNLSKLAIPKPHWQEGGKDKAVYMNVGYCKETGPDSRGAGAQRSKMRWCVVFGLYAGLVVVPLLMFVCAIDNMEAIGSKRQTWISLNGPRLEFIGVRSSWGLLRGGGREEALASNDVSKPRAALQGMGTLLRLGTRAMQELVVAHLTEDTTSEELRLFLRSLHRSGSTARADIVLLFPSSPMLGAMATVIEEEEDSFQKLLSKFKPENDEAPSGCTGACTDVDLLTAPFNAMAFKRRSEDEQQDPAPEITWGRRYGNASATTATATEEDEAGNPSRSSWATWGSVVSFDVQELDSQDALQGFFDTPPVQLRRWLCYDMLLGMVKSRYKNVMVSQVTGVYVLGDALSAVRTQQKLYITAEDVVWRDAKREPVEPAGLSLQPEVGDEDAPRSTVVDLPAVRHESIRRSLRESSSKLKTPDDDDRHESILNPKLKTLDEDHDVLKVREAQQSWRHAPGLIQSVYGSQLWNTLEPSEKQHAVVSPAVILGAVCYVRVLATKMAPEIVRVAMDRKSRRSFHDKAVLNMWVRKKAALGKRIADHLKVVKNQNSVVLSLPSSLSPSSSSASSAAQRSRYLVVHDQNQDSLSQLRHNLCRLDPSVYRQCS